MDFLNTSIKKLSILKDIYALENKDNTNSTSLDNCSNVNRYSVVYLFNKFVPGFVSYEKSTNASMHKLYFIQKLKKSLENLLEENNIYISLKIAQIFYFSDIFENNKNDPSIGKIIQILSDYISNHSRDICDIILDECALTLSFYYCLLFN